MSALPAGGAMKTSTAVILLLLAAVLYPAEIGSRGAAARGQSPDSPPSTPGAKSSAEPPAPAASAPVQKLLDEAKRLGKEKKFVEALTAADQALAVAREARDAAGEG